MYKMGLRNDHMRFPLNQIKDQESIILYITDADIKIVIKAYF